MFPILLTFALLTSDVNRTLSLKARDMQKNCRTCSEASHHWAMMRPTCFETSAFITLLFITLSI